MVLLVENPPRIALASSPAPSGCGSSSSNHVDPEPNRQRPSTPKRLMQNFMGGRISPFRGHSAGGGSGFLSRSASSSSSSKESRSKRNSQVLDRDYSAGDTPMFAPKPNAAAHQPPATASPKTTPFPPVSSPVLHQFESKDETLGSPMIIIQSLSTSDPPSGITSPAEVSSGTSTTSTLSVEIDDEDLASTRSPSPFEDMMDSQMTTSTIETTPEDLPEGLRLMRVAQRHGIKVVDFAFEGAKRQGEVEDWAWEGGAACKGFGIGFGGGAYNGVLKKYRPPPKEMPEEPAEEDDGMMVDKPNRNIFTSKPPAPRPAPIFSGWQVRTVERPLNSPGLPRPAPGLSGSDFMKYLEERRAAQATSAAAAVGAASAQPNFSSDVGFKRDRSFGSSEPHPDDCSPFKRRVLG